MQVDTARFDHTDQYVAYLATTAGKLRLDLAWMNLREFLPLAGANRRAVDVGSGPGDLALRLAELGFSVDLLDSSAAMLDYAREQADLRKLSHRTSFHLGDALSVTDLFERSSFDVVVCHNVLEYVNDPFACLCGVAEVLKKHEASVMSLLVRNRYGEVLKAALTFGDTVFGDSASAETALIAETVTDSLYGKPVRVFDPADVRAMVERAGMQVIAGRGVRVVSDYVESRAMTDEGYERLKSFEMMLGAQPQLAAIARYTQIIARPFPYDGSEA